MKSFFVYEMEYTDAVHEMSGIEMIPFHDRYYSQYEHIYNECFFDMRKALKIEPYSFLSNIQQIKDKKENIFLLMDGETVMGSVGCYGTEIDDLIVDKKYQGRGFGKHLLLWAIKHIREYTVEPITVHVAEWNQRAVKLYTQIGFVIKKRSAL
ncbi:GNAT family N-acetyltransferase [Ruminococcus sp.]|uniref:GNAT family N-acetyltransferase n=1 Tax=Ruminococcus sp. TaxID=41978 RepID=UPI0025F0807A|nr:GNAT family N-acetyltransferase [Ruminococcus sp.]